MGEDGAGSEDRDSGGGVGLHRLDDRRVHLRAANTRAVPAAERFQATNLFIISGSEYIYVRQLIKQSQILINLRLTLDNESYNCYRATNVAASLDHTKNSDAGNNDETS